MEHAARSTLIWEVFNLCMLAYCDFFAVVERCAIKGWPDRATAIRRHIQIQELFRGREIARLRYILDSNVDDFWNSYTRIDLIRRRLTDSWTPSEEEALCRRDSAYAALERRIETMTSLDDSAELDGPLEMAKKDPELLSAASALKHTLLELERRLAR